MDSEQPLPQSRLGRLARLARVGVSTGAALLRDRDATDDAERAAAILGQLRGLAAKVGQMASYVDGVIPEQHRDAYETSLSKLQSAAPKSSHEEITGLLREELGAGIEDLFTEWDDHPIASASIGQVHRARLPDGREVAVKVQHPGVAKALESDLRNAGMLEMTLATLGTRKFESKRLLEEVRERFREELDYGLEAKRVGIFRQIHAGDPTIVIPDVIADHSSHRVLTTELIRGTSFAEACAAPEADRAAWAATLWRFVYKANLVGGVFNADPHPGNYIFQPDGRIGFVDFGCVQPLDEDRRRVATAIHTAANRGDRDAFDAAAREMLMTQGGAYEEMALAYSAQCFRTIFDSPFRITREYSTSLVEQFKDMTMALRKSKDDDYVPMPKGLLFINRLQFGFYSVLARLDAEVDYAEVERGYLEQARLTERGFGADASPEPQAE